MAHGPRASDSRPLEPGAARALGPEPLSRYPHAGQLLAVGDRTFGLYRGPAGSETPPDPVDLGALVRDLPSRPDEGSQWEAVTADATGRVFVLQEYPGQVFVFAPPRSMRWWPRWR